MMSSSFRYVAVAASVLGLPTHYSEGRIRKAVELTMWWDNSATLTTPSPTISCQHHPLSSLPWRLLGELMTIHLLWGFSRVRISYGRGSLSLDVLWPLLILSLQTSKILAIKRFRNDRTLETTRNLLTRSSPRHQSQSRKQRPIRRIPTRTRAAAGGARHRSQGNYVSGRLNTPSNQIVLILGL